VAERGLDVEALEDEIMADNERADAAGLVFDSDARKSMGTTGGNDSGNTDQTV
jgi:capsid protein